MKKLSLFILMTLYLTMSGGVPFHYNYCGGKVTNMAVWHDAGCPKCRNKVCNKCGCCKTVVEVVKVEIDQLDAEPVNPDINEGYVLLNMPKLDGFEIADLTPVPAYSDLERYVPPPEKETGAIYIHNCLFLI